MYIRRIAIGIALIASCSLLLAIYALISNESNSYNAIPWIKYHDGLIEKLKLNERPVLVHFSADWDAHTKATLYHTIETPPVSRVLRSSNYVAVYADCTANNSPAWDLFKSLDMPYIPATIVIRNKKTTKIEDMLTPEQMADVLKIIAEGN